MESSSTPITVGKEVVSDDHYIVVEIAFADGQAVALGDIVAVLETSKGVLDVESPAAGFVFYNVSVNQEVSVGAVLGLICSTAEREEVDIEPIAEESQGDSETNGGGENGPRISKAARRVLKQHELDESIFKGKSIVRETDVLDYLRAADESEKDVTQLAANVSEAHGNRVIIVGGGGHAKMCIDILRQMKTYNIAGIVDSNLRVGQQTIGVPVLGGDDRLGEFIEQGIQFVAVVGFGALQQPGLRQEAFNRLRQAGFLLPNLVHPSAVIEPSATLGEGNQVMAGAIVSSDVRIADNCIVNSGSVVSHDCRLSNNVHVTPGAALAGGVDVGASTIIGMGATIFLNVEIGSDVRINNGARVSRDIPAGSVVKS